MEVCSLGLDVGTQSTKALLINVTTGDIIGRGSSPHTICSNRPGQAEQDPEMWLEAAAAAIAQALSGRPPQCVACVGVSGQQHGMVALDAQSAVLRPAKLWCDTESAAEALELSAALGWSIPAGFTATKLLWLKRHEPEVFSRCASVLLPHDYLNLKLTGRACMERSDASGTGLLRTTGPGASEWCDEACAAVDPRMRSLLPALAPPDAAIGKVTEPAAARFGIPAGIPVAPGGGDNAMAALGAGAAAPGRLVLSLGTSGTIFCPSEAPLRDPSGAVAPFCDAAGAFLPLVCIQNCTGPADEVCSAFSITHAEASLLAAAEPPGCAGVSFLPYLTGERTPNWPGASAALVGLRPGSLRPGLLYRAAMEARAPRFCSSSVLPIPTLPIHAPPPSA